MRRRVITNAIDHLPHRAFCRQLRRAIVARLGRVGETGLALEQLGDLEEPGATVALGPGRSFGAVDRRRRCNKCANAVSAAKGWEVGGIPSSARPSVSAQSGCRDLSREQRDCFCQLEPGKRHAQDPVSVEAIWPGC